MTHPDRLRSHSFTYTVVLEPDEDGGFVVTCPSLPGLVTHGDTVEDARAHAAEAMLLYLECLAADGAPFPVNEVPPHCGGRHEPIAVDVLSHL